MLTTLFSDPVSGSLGLLAAVLAAVYLLLVWRQPRRSRPARQPKRRSRPVRQPKRRSRPVREPENWILVDGSNVMHWQDNAPHLVPVQRVIEQLTALGYTPGVVFDANAGWKLMGRYLHDGDFAQLLGLEKRQVLVVSKGTQADPFLLDTAKDFDARIVTNDRFRDWAEKYPKVMEKGFLIRGEMRAGKAWLSGLEAAQGVP